VQRRGVEPEDGRIALWMFRIQEREVCFWGILSEAVTTAKMYARLHDMSEGEIELLESSPFPRLYAV
jgi:hypothetical protein